MAEETKSTPPAADLPSIPITRINAYDEVSALIDRYVSSIQQLRDTVGKEIELTTEAEEAELRVQQLQNEIETLIQTGDDIPGGVVDINERTRETASLVESKILEKGNLVRSIQDTDVMLNNTLNEVDSIDEYVKAMERKIAIRLNFGLDVRSAKMCLGRIEFAIRQSKEISQCTKTLLLQDIMDLQEFVDLLQLKSHFWAEKNRVTEEAAQTKRKIFRRTKRRITAS